MLVEIVVCLKYLDRNDNKINEQIKKKIIDKSAVLIKKNPSRNYLLLQHHMRLQNDCLFESNRDMKETKMFELSTL